MATKHLHWGKTLSPDDAAAGHTAQRGHPSNPFDEPMHEGHLVKLIAPNYPETYWHQKTGHYYTSVEEPDPHTPGGTRLVAYVWPQHVGEMLAANPPYRLPEHVD